MNAAPVYCQTTVNYATTDNVLPRQVDIHDGRMATLAGWQETGFELLKHQSSVTDWTNPTQLQQIYYGEMAAKAKQMTGCKTAMISGHITRNPAAAKTHSDYAPIEFVHSDFTDTYGDITKARYAANGELEAASLANAGITLDELLNAQDLMILQFWRNVGPANVDKPLAFCDAQSVPKADVHAFHVPNYAGGDFAFDTFAVSPAPADRPHAWYTYPNLAADEVVAIRTFDSRRIGSNKPYWTPHTAFADPNPGEKVARFSIEVRATCLF